MKQSSEHKICNTLVIKAFYKTVNQEPMPEDPAEKTKACPNTIRETLLLITNLLLDNISEEYVPDSTSHLTRKASSQRLRNSTTNH